MKRILAVFLLAAILIVPAAAASDFTDVPEWAPPMYEEKYGQKWLFTGPGLLLVGNGDIIVLEESTCFQSKNLLKISVAEGYEEKFGKHSVNFYT